VAILALAGVVAASVAAAGVVLALRRSPHERPPAREGSPTILLILTDDQRWDTLSSMASVQSELVGHGVTFENSFAVDPLCCPDRAGILTGQYPHTTGIWRNRPPMGGFPDFRDGSTVATWLHDAGYRTGLFGKYLNAYEGTTYIPPGWDRWLAFAGASLDEGNYYDYEMNDDGRLVEHGDAPPDYSTSVISTAAQSFIPDSTGPLFLYVAPAAPHAPATPAPPDVGSFRDLPPFRPPSYGRVPQPDPPAWLARRAGLTAQGMAKLDRLRADSLASLLSVDRMVHDLVAALADTGRLSNSLIVFTSDNGLLWGEHGLTGKVVPYDESIRVPMVVRYDPVVGTVRTDSHLVLNVDLAPTFAAVAGVQSPGAEGASLLPLLEGTTTGPSWRTGFLIESMHQSHVPSYCGIRTDRYVYVVYETGEAELYDLQADPYELENLATDPGSAAVLSGFDLPLRDLCRDPPPGFTSPP
jgi:arylsulfatase A-like enzyme